MPTTLPIDLTTDRLIEFNGTIRTIAMEEIGRDVYLWPSPAPTDACGAIMLDMCLQGKTGEELRAWLHDQPEAVAYRTSGGSTPPAPPADHVIDPLYASGVDLRTSDDARVVLCGSDMFTALRMVLDGTDLQPFVDESHAYGFNLWRVFGQASMTENGYYTVLPTEPGYYEALDHLAYELREEGIYLLFTCYADNQVIHSGLDHWTRCADVLRPYADGVFLSGGNEWQKNGFDPAGLPDPDLPWWSRGSSLGDEKPPDPTGASFIEFHPRRDFYKALDDTVCSPNFIRYDFGWELPLIIDEPPRMGEDGSGDAYTDPLTCWRFARNYASMCAGAVFHARPGQKGFLIPPGSITDQCAKAWQLGMSVA